MYSIVWYQERRNVGERYLLSCRRGTNVAYCNKNNTQYFFPNLPQGWNQHDLVGGWFGGGGGG